MTYSLNSNYTNSSYQQSMGLGQNIPLNIDKEKIKEDAKNNNNIVTIMETASGFGIFFFSSHCSNGKYGC